MKFRFLYTVLLCLFAFSASAQDGLVSGELNVSAFPTNNGDGTFTLSGAFSDPKGLYFASDVTTGMSIWKGNNYFEITAASANGSTLTLSVQDSYVVGFLATGIYSVGETTERLRLPGISTTGDSNPALTTPPDYAAKMNYILRLIDAGIPGATKGTSLSDTSTIANPVNGDIFLAGDTLSFYNGQEWVNYNSSTGSETISVLDTTVIANYNVSADYKETNIVSDLSSNDVVITLPKPFSTIQGHIVTVDQINSDIGLTYVRTVDGDEIVSTQNSLVDGVFYTPGENEYREFRVIYDAGRTAYLWREISADGKNINTVKIDNTNLVLSKNKGADVSTDLFDLRYDFNQITDAFGTKSFDRSVFENSYREKYKLVDEVPEEFNGGIADSMYYVPVSLKDTIANIAYFSEYMIQNLDVETGITMYNGNAVKTATGSLHEGGDVFLWSHDAAGNASKVFLRTPTSINPGDTLTVSFSARSKTGNVDVTVESGSGLTSFIITNSITQTIGQTFKRYVYTVVANDSYNQYESRSLNIDGFDGEIEITKLMITKGSNPGTYHMTTIPSLNSGKIYAQYVLDSPVIELASVPSFAFTSDSEVFDRSKEFCQINDYRATKIKLDARTYYLDRTLYIPEQIYFEGAAMTPSQFLDNDEPIFGTVLKTRYAGTKKDAIRIEKDPNLSNGPHNNCGISNLSVEVSNGDGIGTGIYVFETSGLVLKNINFIGDVTQIEVDTCMVFQKDQGSDAVGNSIHNIDFTNIRADVGIRYDFKNNGNPFTKIYLPPCNSRTFIMEGGTFKGKTLIWQKQPNTIIEGLGGEIYMEEFYTEQADSTILDLNNTAFHCTDCNLKSKAGQTAMVLKNYSSLSMYGGLIEGTEKCVFDESTKYVDLEKVKTSFPAAYYDYQGLLKGRRVSIDANFSIIGNKKWPPVYPLGTLTNAKIDQSVASDLTLESMIVAYPTVTGRYENRIENSFRVGDSGTESLNASGASDFIEIETDIEDDHLGGNNATMMTFTGENTGISTSSIGWFGRNYEESGIDTADFVTFSIYMKATEGYPVNVELFSFRPFDGDDDIIVRLPAGLKRDEYTEVETTIQIQNSTSADVNGVSFFRLPVAVESEFTASDTIWLSGMSFVQGDKDLGYVETSSSGIVETDIKINNEVPFEFEGGVLLNGQTPVDTGNNTITGTGSPLGSITPGFIGQYYIDETTPSSEIIWFAVGTLNTAWIQLN